jgi:hypothetical protein
MLWIFRYFNHLIKNQTLIVRLQFALFGFMNNILSGTKYRVSPEGVSLMDETNNLAVQLAHKIQILHAIPRLARKLH